MTAASLLKKTLNCQDVFFVLCDTPYIWPWLQMRLCGLSLMLRKFNNIKKSRRMSATTFSAATPFPFILYSKRLVAAMWRKITHDWPHAGQKSPIFIPFVSVLDKFSISGKGQRLNYYYATKFPANQILFKVFFPCMLKVLRSSECVLWLVKAFTHIITVLQNHLHLQISVSQEEGRFSLLCRFWHFAMFHQSDSLNIFCM